MISTYVGAENIALTTNEKTAFRDTLSQIGPVDHHSPAEIMHWRTRLDGDAVIMRAQFQDSDLSQAGLRQLIATVLGVPIASVTSAQTTATYATIASTIFTMSVASVEKMRFILFGGGRVSVAQSNAEVLAYLKANAAAWGDG